ncbi:GNAT family N-acetyltransferase [Endozoicomonas euniceicola]|uniref:GNAT family N-acetyltransferase n=1 Tax=Endozoicomonas euniceicola TaxID=1234143 RepID=A0ABY6GPL4_9GAMM|nr:GNAT family N-acetyltransferase [Endozoicomonas euniceicola]UYM14640.1 GNAT family N-acetyltransferase [Endozoicomonas euniceicola]
MEIRKASQNDIDSLLNLNCQIGEFHYQNAPTVFAKPSSEEREFLLKAISDPDRLFLVATLQNKVCGFITATITKNEAVPFLRKEPICRIGTIVIDEQHRSTGLGKALMNKCYDWAVSSGASQIRLEVMEFNSNAQDFYAGLGFKTQSRIMCQAISS